MYKFFVDISKILGTKERKKSLIFLFLMIIATFFETITVAIVFPAVNLIMDINKTNFIKELIINLTGLEIKDSTEILYIFLVIFFIIIFIKAAYLIFFNWWRNSFVYSLEKLTGYNLYKRYLNYDLNQFIKLNYASLSKNIIIDTVKVRMAVDFSLKLATETLTILAIISILLLYQPYPTLITLFFGILVSLIAYYSFKTKIYSLGKKELKLTDNIFKSLRDGFASFKLIKILNNEKFFLKPFFKIITERTNVLKYLQIIPENIKIIIELFSVLFICLLIFGITKADNSLKNIIPVLSLYGVALYRLLPGFIRLIQYSHQIQSFKPAINLINNDLDLNNIDIKIRSVERENFQKILFSNTCFNYDNKNQIIKNLNFKILKNDFIVLSGLSGEGKTTFIDLLSGLLKPTSGKIFIDNNNLNKVRKNWLKSIGYVPQKNYLINDTIKNNIVMDNHKNYNHKNMIYALKFSELDKFIKIKKGGINFKIGSDGQNISGGENQRIGIARGLFLRPKILICDEITSSLDKHTENKILNSMLKLKGKITIVFITHRPEIFKSRGIKKFLMKKDAKGNTKINRVSNV